MRGYSYLEAAARRGLGPAPRSGLFPGHFRRLAGLHLVGDDIAQLSRRTRDRYADFSRFGPEGLNDKRAVVIREQAHLGRRVDTDREIGLQVLFDQAVDALRQTVQIAAVVRDVEHVKDAAGVAVHQQDRESVCIADTPDQRPGVVGIEADLRVQDRGIVVFDVVQTRTVTRAVTAEEIADSDFAAGVFQLGNVLDALPL